jgi:hypothetical protein
VLVTLTSGAVAALALFQQIDTTVTAQQGQRLVVDSYGGEIAVKTWGRNAVRVEADPPSRTAVEVSSSSAAVSIRSEGRRGPPASIDYTITVPAWMGLDLSGVYTDVTVEGVRGPITVETVQGEVDVAGGEGTVSLRSVQGSVKLRGAKGRIDVHSVNDEVVLERVDATSLNATTVNGDLGYDGPIRNGGRYILSTHNGDITSPPRRTRAPPSW